jgi:hypothetical protein
MSAAASSRPPATAGAARLAGPRSLSFRPGRWPARPSRRLSALLLLSLLAAGCAAPRQVAVPGRLGSPSAPAPASPASPSPGHAPLSARQRVAAAYRGYWRAYDAAWRSRNAPRARQILAPYDAADGLGLTVHADQRNWAAHLGPDGNAITHVLSVHVTGRRAMLHDCLDLSHLAELDTRTGQLIAGSYGPPRQNFYVTLVLRRGRWLVSNMQLAAVPCTP